MISGSDSRKHAQSRLGVKVRLPASRRPVARGQCAAAESGSELIEQKIPPWSLVLILCCERKRGVFSKADVRIQVSSWVDLM